jgi:hypothetical protein
LLFPTFGVLAGVWAAALAGFFLSIERTYLSNLTQALYRSKQAASVSSASSAQLTAMMTSAESRY